MAKKATTIYQFKIALNGSNPAVWRRIQVPSDYSFWDLHVAIQDAMGWQDYHLHEFMIAHPKTGVERLIGLPDDETEWSAATLAGWQTAVADYFTLENSVAQYTYDFGDNWQHRITLEAIAAAEPGVTYPRCVAGARACPPEDVGGVWGYEAFLRVIGDPDAEEHDWMLEWAGGAFDADAFRPEAVSFDDPGARWQRAFGNAGIG